MKRLGLWRLSRIDSYTNEMDVDLKNIPQDKVEKRLRDLLRKFK